MASKAVGDSIALDRSDGKAVGLRATPYFIVNGAPYNSSYVDLIYELENEVGAE
jgi:protein-disulfide isomerase